MTAPLITLNDGNAIPSVGLGVFQTPPQETEQAVSAALRAGYRHIDTASGYDNEREVGRAIAKSDIPREEIFVVTKLWNADQGYHSTMKAFQKSAKRLGLDREGGYLDLYLIHWPVPAIGEFVDTWRAFGVVLRQFGDAQTENRNDVVVIERDGRRTLARRFCRRHLSFP